MKKLFIILGVAGFLLTPPAFLCAQGTDLAFKGYELRMNGDPHGALALLDSSLLLHPESAPIWFEKGRCVDWIKMEGCTKFTHIWKYTIPRLKISRRCFSKAISLDPDNARYHYWAAENGALLSLTGIYSPWKWCAVPFMMRRSVNHAETSVLLKPDDPHYRYTLCLYARMGRLLGGKPKLARAHADSLEQIDPVYATMVRKEMETKKHPYDANSRYIQLESQYPDHIQLNLRLGQMNGSQPDKAVYYYRTVLQQDPLNVEALRGIERLMVRNKREDLVSDIRKYIDHATTSYTFYQAVGIRALGKYYELIGNKEKTDECNAEANRLSHKDYQTSVADLKPPVRTPGY